MQWIKIYASNSLLLQLSTVNVEVNIKLYTPKYIMQLVTWMLKEVYVKYLVNKHMQMFIIGIRVNIRILAMNVLGNDIRMLSDQIN